MSIMVDRDQDRHSSKDANNRDASGGKNDADPLAELARLIGQSDPFANFGRANPSHPTRRTQPVEPPPQPYSERVREQAPDVPSQGPSSGPSWMKHRTLQNRPPLPTPSPVENSATDDTDINATPHPLHRYAAQQAHVEPEPHLLPDHEAPSFVTDPYPSDPAAHDPHAAHYPDDRYDDQLYGAVQPTQDELYAQHHEQSYGHGDAGYGYADQYAESEQRKPRSKGLVTVAAVMALAVIGTGGAYAYRNFVGSSRSGEPPVIKADTNPIKVVPPTSTADAAANGKLIQDRLASGGGEKMVSREETPVDPRDPSKAGPRVVFPPLNANGNPPTTASVSPTGRTMSAPQTAPGDEPRKIKTFIVKGDQADANGIPVARPAARSAAPVTATKQPAANANASTNAPMSLSPQAATPAESRSRVAALTPAPAVSGGYVVQVASQRSETDARASFKSLQGKYPSVLGSRSVEIKRADLGTKGTYYRAVVGPFSSSDDATTVCGNLKTAGGQCVVQRN